MFLRLNDAQTCERRKLSADELIAERPRAQWLVLNASASRAQEISYASVPGLQLTANCILVCKFTIR